MPSPRRTDKSKNAGHKRDDFREHEQRGLLGLDEQQHARLLEILEEHARGGLVRDERVAGGDDVENSGQPRRWRRVGLPVPPASAVTTVSAVGGGTGLTAAIVTGQVQPGIVWPTVTLTVAGMAYDLIRQAILRNRPV
ncbi:hypothetical protein ACN2WE_00265 [Streptomyces sp. cg28]|uniref:hypothetical protein n=1 Tax=Streptomyces sp. cg28 TaxID=3403457 RepID=UPI003B216B91